MSGFLKVIWLVCELAGGGEAEAGHCVRACGYMGLHSVILWRVDLPLPWPPSLVHTIPRQILDTEIPTQMRPGDLGPEPLLEPRVWVCSWVEPKDLNMACPVQ